MRVLDLFSGIGGFSLGLERAGMRTIQFCEIDPYCRAVLAKHWPTVPCHDDIRTLYPTAADVICGGFPCQDISNSGHKAGIDGLRSGLWGHFARIICYARPRYVIVENVTALLHRGLGRILGDLAAIGYDAEWDCISASDVGSPQLRDRCWILAYPESERRRSVHPKLGLLQETREHCARLARDRGASHPSYGEGVLRAPESGLVRVADGLPGRAHRIRALGNSLDPAIPKLIGRAIMEHAHG